MGFVDDLKRGAGSLFDDASRLTEAAKLKVNIRALETELGDRIYDLGTRALDLHRRNELHHYELDELFVEIQRLQKLLRQREGELEKLLGHGGGGESAAAATCPTVGPMCMMETGSAGRAALACGDTHSQLSTKANNALMTTRPSPTEAT